MISYIISQPAPLNNQFDFRLKTIIIRKWRGAIVMIEKLKNEMRVCLGSTPRCLVC